MQSLIAPQGVVMVFYAMRLGLLFSSCFIFHGAKPSLQFPLTSKRAHSQISYSVLQNKTSTHTHTHTHGKGVKQTQPQSRDKGRERFTQIQTKRHTGKSLTLNFFQPLDTTEGWPMFSLFLKSVGKQCFVIVNMINIISSYSLHVLGKMDLEETTGQEVD